MAAAAKDDATAETVVLEETGLGPFEVKATTGSATFYIDEPIGSGLGSGPTPYDLLSAAIGSCTLMTIRLYANSREWPLESIRIKVTHLRGGLLSPGTFIREIQLIGPLDAQQKAKLIDVSTRCPVHLALARGSDVETILLADGHLDHNAITRYAHMEHMVEACEM